MPFIGEPPIMSSEPIIEPVVPLFIIPVCASLPLLAATTATTARAMTATTAMTAKAMVVDVRRGPGGSGGTTGASSVLVMASPLGGELPADCQRCAEAATRALCRAVGAGVPAGHRFTAL